MRTLCTVLFQLLPAVCLAADLTLDESPARDGDWGYRPVSGAVSGATRRLLWNWRRPRKESGSSLRLRRSGPGGSVRLR